MDTEAAIMGQVTASHEGNAGWRKWFEVSGADKAMEDGRRLAIGRIRGGLANKEKDPELAAQVLRYHAEILARDSHRRIQRADSTTAKRFGFSETTVKNLRLDKIDTLYPTRLQKAIAEFRRLQDLWPQEKPKAVVSSVVEGESLSSTEAARLRSYLRENP